MFNSVLDSPYFVKMYPVIQQNIYVLSAKTKRHPDFYGKSIRFALRFATYMEKLLPFATVFKIGR